MLRFFLGAFCLLVVSPSYAADPGVSDTEVVIGGHTSESGKFTQSSSVPRGAQAYFDKVNKAGGVHGRKIKYIRVDSQGEFPKTVQGTKRLVEEDKIFAMFLGMGPSHKAVYNYLIERGVPDFSFADMLLEYSNPPKKGIFPGMPPIYLEGKLFAEHVTKKHKGKKACFLITDDAVGEEFLKGAKEGLEEGNKKLPDKEKVKIGVGETVNRSAPQANTQVLSLKRDNCEVVLTSTFGSLAPGGISYGFSQGFKPAWYVMAYNASPKFITLLPPAMQEGVVSDAWIAPSEDFGVPGWKEFKEHMDKDGIPLARAEVGYAQAELMVEALKRAGRDLTRDGFNKAVESMSGFKCSLCLIPVTPSPTNHLMFAKGQLVVTKGGKWVRLE